MDKLIPTIVVACMLAWITHIVVCLAQAKIGILIAGALLFPIGIIHGFYCWVSWLF
ncbi:hypothetical protein [Dyella sp. ASV21]|uniref:hypothetical protein n=1 Tax=Dyella sp. ASV21 TaxID=2795114 RepID=UPI0018EDD2F6|nr:hypothetical protein [Dyella sp. ASV21]